MKEQNLCLNFRRWALTALSCALLALAAAGSAAACDPCAVYMATDLHGFSERRMALGVSEVFTKYRRTDEGGRLRSGEVLRRDSTTELALTVDVSKHFSLQGSLPVIHRGVTEDQEFRRREDSTTGFGDASLLFQYAPLLYGDLDRTVYGAVYSGIKFPTGSTGSLSGPDEDFGSDGPLRGADIDYRLAHHVGGTVGIQGRVLTFGSGSYDFPLGTSLFVRQGRLFAYGGFQYTIRNKGAFGYRFSDDITWNAGPAAYVYLGGHEFTVALRGSVSGEHKGSDSRRGERVDGTSIDSIFAGPELLITAFGRYTGELALDLPISTGGSSLEEPAYRVRAAMSYSF